MAYNNEILHLPPGRKLFGGRYTIRCFIGAGGFGCTYEAEISSTGARVAIKEFFVNSCCNRSANGTVSVGTSSQAPLVRRLEEKFKQEAQNLSRLQHPNIVHVSDFFEENGTSYYVMDYIEGRSMQSTINNNGPLPEAKALHYLNQVMDALEYVHGKNMLHLDIKPDNIMIDADDHAILIDFGVSKQYDEIDGHNTSTIMGHTPGYAPPEQSGNSIKQFTPASDIYALGATLYSAITACWPPSSNDLISGEVKLQPLPDGTSMSTHRAIYSMMQPGVKQRPQTIGTVRALLNGADSTGTQLVDSLQQNNSKKKLWIAISLVTIVMGLVFVCFLILPTEHTGENTNEFKLSDPINSVNHVPEAIEDITDTDIIDNDSLNTSSYIDVDTLLYHTDGITASSSSQAKPRSDRIESQQQNTSQQQRPNQGVIVNSQQNIYSTPSTSQDPTEEQQEDSLKRNIINHMFN